MKQLSWFMVLLLCITSVTALTITHDPNPVSDVGNDYFVVEWNTDVPAISNVGYGLRAPPDQQRQTNTLVTTHALRVDALQPGTEYFFQILAVAQGQTRIDDNGGQFYRVVTGTGADTRPPVITNVTVTKPDDVSAIVRWTTDELASTLAWYGIGATRTQAQGAGPLRTHEVRLQVQRGQQYTVIVGSCDRFQNCANASSVGFYAGVGALPLNVTVPPTTKTGRVDIRGTTVPGAQVRVIVNDIPSRALVTGPDGSFLFSDVTVPAPQATVLVTVRDVSGTTQEQQFPVISDSVPPIMTLAQGVPDYTADPILTLSGTVNEPVTITFGVTKEGAAPGRIAGLRASRITQNTVDLDWTLMPQVTHYAVYRNTVRIAVVSAPRYSDSVSSGVQYVYKVAGISATCQEGAAAQTDVTTASGGLQVNLTPLEVPLVCGPERQSITANGPFSIPIRLEEGQNRVLIEATDRAGNVARISNLTTVDTKPPQIIEHNLNQLSPTYTSSVEVKGRLNKQGTVLITVNSEKPIVVLTDRNGSFSKEVSLSRDANLTTTRSPISVTGETAQGWTNHITLEASDAAGRKVGVGPIPIIYSLCGFGSTFSIDLGKPLPDVLTPRLILQGVQQAGFSLNASYRGGRQLSRPGTVTIRKLTLSATQLKKYDHDWINLAFLNNPRKPTEGFVQLTFNPQQTNRGTRNVSLSALEEALSEHRKGECKVPGAGCVRMLLEVEVRAQEKIPKVFGDIRTQGSAEDFLLNDVSQRTCVDVEIQIDKALLLQKHIPKKFLAASVSFLDTTIDVIDKAVQPLITIGTYTTYGCMAMNAVLYGMFFSERLTCDFANIEAKGPVAAAFEAVIGRGTAIHDVAEVGLCETAFRPTGTAGPTTTIPSTPTPEAAADTQKAYLACKKCQETIARRKALEAKMRVVCDRVACPSAPTLQTYIRDNQKNNPLKQVVLPSLAAVQKPINGVQGLVYRGNSCAFKGEGGQKLSVGYSSGSAPPCMSTITFDKVTGITKIECYVAGGTTRAATPEEQLAVRSVFNTKYADKSTLPTTTSQVNLDVTFGDKGIKEIYTDYLTKHKDDKEFTLDEKVALTGPDKVSCAGLHPANPECCGYEYYQEWGSACGIPGVFETFDELKESSCLAAQNANQIADFERTTGKQCKSLFNAVAGFCEPDSGQPVGEDLRTTIRYHPDYQNTLAAPDLSEIYIRMEPVGADNSQWLIARGYISKTVVRQQLSDPAKISKIEREQAVAERLRANKQTSDPKKFHLNAELEFVADEDGDLTQFFTEAASASNPELAQQIRDLKPGQVPPGFAAALCRHAVNPAECAGAPARRVYADIKSRIGVSDKIYIVRPDRDGILRSTQCMCIPAVTSYLTFWKNVLGAVRNCFETVRITGDASAGVCQAVLSQYVCDMLFDVMSCFTQKYGTPGAGTSFGGSGGIGDVLGALSKAGGDMQGSINSRYGDTALWRSMFVERKLVHSVCAFAFTGTWDLDVAGVFKQTVDDIPLKSQAFLYPAERRFISYNPITRPSGLPTFTYHFGVGLVAGQDLRYQLELKCSNNLRCEPRDGFESGKCDCTGRSEQRILVGAPELGSGSLKKNDILNTEVFYTIQGGDPASAVRYDTAILSWEALDPGSGQVTREKKEIPIHLVGSRPPNFCRFDPVALAFRCDIGIGDYTGARIIPPIVPAYPQAQDAFIINDELVFKVPVLLQYPQSLKEQAACIGACPYTKFLNYEVRNQMGQPVIELRKPEEVSRSSQLRVEKNGDDTLTIRLNAGGSRRIKKTDFSFSSAAASPVRFVDSESARFTTPRPTSALQIGVVLVVTKTAGVYKWELFDTVNDGERVSSSEASYIERAPDKESSGQWGWYRKGAARPEGSGQLVQGDTVTTRNPEITFKVPSTFDLKRPAEYYLPATPVAGGTDDICTGFGTTPAKWKVTFKMFDSAQVAGGTAYEYNPAQPTVDPSSGEVQEQTIEFNVLCNEKFQGGGGSIRECPPNSALKLDTLQCFCGGPTEVAQAREQLRNDPQASVLNCGTGAPVGPAGLYCVSRDEANPSAGRYCSNTPGSGSVVVGGTQQMTPAKVSYSSRVRETSAEQTIDITSSISAESFDIIPNKYALVYEYRRADVPPGTYSATATLDGAPLQVNVNTNDPTKIIFTVDLIESIGRIPVGPSGLHTVALALLRDRSPVGSAPSFSYRLVSPVRLEHREICQSCTAVGNYLRGTVRFPYDDEPTDDLPQGVAQKVVVAGQEYPNFDPSNEGTKSSFKGYLDAYMFHLSAVGAAGGAT